MPRSRALTVCSHPGCPVLVEHGRCDEHADAPWAGSKRAERIGVSRAQEQRARRRILRRDRGVCHVCHRPGADQVDHVIPLGEGGSDDDSNKAAIHARPCHQRKTAAEAARGRSRAQR